MIIKAFQFYNLVPTLRNISPFSRNGTQRSNRTQYTNVDNSLFEYIENFQLKDQESAKFYFCTIQVLMAWRSQTKRLLYQTTFFEVQYHNFIRYHRTKTQILFSILWAQRKYQIFHIRSPFPIRVLKWIMRWNYQKS